MIPLDTSVFLSLVVTFHFRESLNHKMINTQPQRTSATSSDGMNSQMFQRPRNRPPSRFKRRKHRRKRPLSEEWDYPMDKTWKESLHLMFYKDLYIEEHKPYIRDRKFHEGHYFLRLSPFCDLRRLKLKLSWVMGSRSLKLSRDEVLREIVTRFQQYFPDKFKDFYSDARY